MPKDAWASTRRRNTIKRIIRADKWANRRPRGGGKKRRKQAKSFSRVKPTTYVLRAGTHVEIRKAGRGNWTPYLTQKTVQATLSALADEFTYLTFQNWSIRIPRPKGF